MATYTTSSQLRHWTFKSNQPIIDMQTSVNADYINKQIHRFTVSVPFIGWILLDGEFEFVNMSLKEPEYIYVMLLVFAESGSILSLPLRLNSTTIDVFRLDRITVRVDWYASLYPKPFSETECGAVISLPVC